MRPTLLRRLYPEIGALSTTGTAFLQAFFKRGLTDVEAPEYSHAIRWGNTRRTHRLFSKDLLQAAMVGEAADTPNWPGLIPSLPWLERAQHLEISSFMSPYLLSSQGDRVSMAHSVEGRYPFLDCRVIDFCTRLPTRLKLRGLNDKHLLRRLAAEWLPEEIWRRAKRPYRPPIQRTLVNQGSREYLGDVLTSSSLEATGYFNPGAVGKLMGKIQGRTNVSETDEMALAGVVSTQLWHEKFVNRPVAAPPLPDGAKVKVCRGTPTAGRS